MGQFTAYGPSHLIVVGVFVVGAVALVAFGRSQGDSEVWLSRAGAIVLAGFFVVGAVYPWFSDRPDRLDFALPIHLSDLATIASAVALWTRSGWAFALTYYWGLVLSTQALLSPALDSADFPSYDFLAFWVTHVLVIWAAIYLTWGLGMRPDWRRYGFTAAVTTVWAAVAMAVNTIADTNYGFLNAKPESGSVMDFLGPWPLYLLPLAGLVLGVWALMTWPWVRRVRV